MARMALAEPRFRRGTAAATPIVIPLKTKPTAVPRFPQLDAWPPPFPTVTMSKEAWLQRQGSQGIRTASRVSTSFLDSRRLWG
jgi:hypothetical protein